jgi:hypothetical protein
VFDAARKFLQDCLPWPTQHDNWWINIHHTWTPPGADRAVLPGRAFKNIDDALAHVQWLAQGQPTDIYVCMSGQSKIKPGVNIRNNAERSVEGSVAFKSIRLDVDLKSPGYATTAEALQELARFCSFVKLGMPTKIVYSGSGGFHVHWCSREVMDHPTWHQLSHALQAACFAFGFTVDGKVTTDAARVLRIPDTHNWKIGTIGKSVTLGYDGTAYDLQFLTSTLARFFSPYSVVSARMGGNTTPRANFVWASTVPIRKPKIRDPKWAAIGGSAKVPLPDILRGACNWIRHVAKVHGKDQIEPLWREALAVAYYTEEGRALAHVLSNQHPMPHYPWSRGGRVQDLSLAGQGQESP